MKENVDLNSVSLEPRDHTTTHALVSSVTPGHYRLTTDKELTERITELAILQGATTADVALAVFKIMLYRYGITDSIAVWHPTTEGTATNWQIEINGNMTVRELIIAACECHATEGEQGNVPLAFACSEGDTPEAIAGNYHLALCAYGTDTLKAEVRHEQQYYTAHTTGQMLAHYAQLLQAVTLGPDQKVGALQMLTPAEYEAIVEQFNATAEPYEHTATLHTLFERQAAKTPAATALYMGEQTMTYGTLNRRANQLARYLAANGVNRGDNVALLVTRDFDMITGMLGILKAGAAYVPITPDTPADRQEYIIKQSGVCHIVYNTAHTLTTERTGARLVDMRHIDYERLEATDLCLHLDSNQLAYTIYTSGSTGVPKGVMIEHHMAVNLVHWVNNTFNVNETDRLLFITSMGFDLSVYDIFGMLAAGGGIVIAQKEEVPNIATVAQLLQRFRITFWDSVPSTIEHLVNRLAATDAEYRQTDLRLVFMSGDWIPVSLPDKIKRFFPNARNISLGGATEGTVWSNYYVIDEVKKDWKSIPYGKPITNNSFYILNEQLQPVPYGTIGELYIGGVGVARGYANDPEKTNYAFVPDPFHARWGGRMYRTGDLGRMLPEGMMEFAGRKDSQVKIRGHRVELGEIESVIRQCRSVANAVVLLSADKKHLICFVVPGQYYDRDSVMAFTKKKLPEYMLPGRWVEIDEMPLTTNGKTDLKALLKMESGEQVRERFVAPKTDLEKTLAAVWCDVLQLKEVGVNDNFFDLGGQSLIAVELINEMEQRTGNTLPVNILYKHPTIAAIVTYLQQQTPGRKWRSLVTIKGTGTKMPVYIVHGDGLSLSNFENLAGHVDADQPVYSLQPIGLNGSDEPLECITEIAKNYVAEIIAHNPEGPYALGGYSFGGYVAIEMKKQLEGMGRRVKMVAIFDTNAQNVLYTRNWVTMLPKRIARQAPKLVFIAKSLILRPGQTLQYQYTLFGKKLNNLCYKLGIKQRPALNGVNKHIDKINETHLRAFRKYDLTPFDDKVYLFKAKSRLYFVDDFQYLGWKNYAQKGVEVYEVPGDHRTIFDHPNVMELARSLQHALDNC